MITSDNIKAVLDALDQDQVELIMSNTKTDYFLIYITGNHGWVMVEEFYDHLDEEALSSGGFIADRDQILQLAKESNTNNKFLIEYL